MQLLTASFQPRRQAVSKMTRLVRVTGTGLIGIGRAKGARMQVIAVITAAKAIFWVEISFF